MECGIRDGIRDGIWDGVLDGRGCMGWEMIWDMGGVG